MLYLHTSILNHHTLSRVYMTNSATLTSTRLTNSIIYESQMLYLHTCWILRSHHTLTHASHFDCHEHITTTKCHEVTNTLLPQNVTNSTNVVSAHIYVESHDHITHWQTHHILTVTNTLLPQNVTNSTNVVSAHIYVESHAHITHWRTHDMLTVTNTLIPSNVTNTSHFDCHRHISAHMYIESSQTHLFIHQKRYHSIIYIQVTSSITLYITNCTNQSCTGNEHYHSINHELYHSIIYICHELYHSVRHELYHSIMYR